MNYDYSEFTINSAIDFRINLFKGVFGKIKIQHLEK